MTELIFVAAPYTYVTPPGVRECGALTQQWLEAMRARAAARYAAFLISCGQACYCPIAHGMSIACAAASVSRDWQHWAITNDAILAASAELHVLQLPHWDISGGVAHEIRVAQGLDIEVTYVRPDIGLAVAGLDDLDLRIISTR